MHQGTDASISTHIENILKRNYVELIPGRKLKPSRLGLVLAQGYHLIDSSLVLPQVRSDIELECNKIAKGLADRDAVVCKAIESEYHRLALGSVILIPNLKLCKYCLYQSDKSVFSSKFLYFVENINRMDYLFGSSFAQIKDVGKPFTRCGLTRWVNCYHLNDVPSSSSDTILVFLDDTFNSLLARLLGCITKARKPCIRFRLEARSSNGLAGTVRWKAVVLSFVSILLEHLREHSRCVRIVSTIHAQNSANSPEKRQELSR